MSIVYIRFPLGLPPASVDSRSADIPREPLLERLLASAAAPVYYQDWREDAWQLLQASSPSRRAQRDAQFVGRRPAAGPVALFAAEGATGDGYVCVASPLHCVAGMTNVRLPPGGLLQLSAAEASELAQDFARVFAEGGSRLIAAGDGALCCLFDRSLDAVTRDPEGVIGGDIGPHLPQGPDGPRLRGLMSEIEMWLFEHPVNLARTRRQELPITGLWLWEGGPTLTSLPALPAWVDGPDVLFSAWPSEGVAAARRSGLILGRGPPDTAVWREFESGRLVRLLSELRSGGLTRLELSASDRRYSLGRHWRWRFWRRSRPWQQFFA